jgi:hypothetical protein
MAATQGEGFRVVGVVRETETDRPLPDLIVRAFDRDLVFDDKLGDAVTDDDGRFEIRYERQDFRDLLERRPDLYLRVFDRTGVRVLHETSDATRRNASQSEAYEIAIPARALDPRRSSK